VKYVLYYESGDADPARLMELFPAHRANWAPYAERGELLMIGPFSDRSGALSIFTTREAAEACAATDPFVTAGLVGSWAVREWMEALVE